MRRISVEEFRAELQAQGVSGMEHGAFKCVACGTVQSMALLSANGVPEAKLQTQIGFSCVGRWTHRTGLPASDKWGGPRTDGKIGCDWTLGGLFQQQTADKLGRVHIHLQNAALALNVRLGVLIGIVLVYHFQLAADQPPADGKTVDGPKLVLPASHRDPAADLRRRFAQRDGIIFF